MPRLLFLTLLCGLLVAQQPATKGQDQTRPQPFSVEVTNILASVLVYDRAGNYVNGLEPNQFRIFDNGKEQNIHAVDVTFTPLSMVVLIQASARADKILPAVNRIGNLLKPIVLGDQGEAAVVAFDSRIRVLQPFTSDSDQITQAIKKITSGSTSSRLMDGLEESIRLLDTRNKDRRRIILVIGETRDGGSEARTRETLIQAQLKNVVVEWVDMSHLFGTLTAPGPDPRPDNLPPAMHPMPSGVPATPTTVQQAYGTNGGSAEFIPLMVEIFKDVKNIFKTSPATLFTKGTGGNQFSFLTQKSLENAIQAIGDQLHSEYTISYSPNNREEAGFHQIAVEVIGHDYRCQTRPGYWVASKF